MEFEARFGIVGLLVASVLGILAIMFLSTGGTPTQAQMREALERELDRFRSPETVMCGIVPKGSSRADAISCARTSIGSRTPFLAVFQEQGEDSDVWSGLAGNTAGHVQALTFDSSPHGQPQTRAQYFVTSRECLAPRLAEVWPELIRCRYDARETRPADVSMIQLLAAPENHQGRVVRVLGFLQVQFEGDALYLHREDSEQALYKNGLWINIPEDQRTAASKLNENYVIVEGMFDATRRGHLDLWSGELTGVTRIDLYQNQ